MIDTKALNEKIHNNYSKNLTRDYVSSLESDFNQAANIFSKNPLLILDENNHDFFRHILRFSESDDTLSKAFDTLLSIFKTSDNPYKDTGLIIFDCLQTRTIAQVHSTFDREIRSNKTLGELIPLICDSGNEKLFKHLAIFINNLNEFSEEAALGVFHDSTASFISGSFDLDGKNVRKFFEETSHVAKSANSHKEDLSPTSKIYMNNIIPAIGSRLGLTNN